MDMLKEYGAHKLAYITYREIAYRRKTKEQDLYGYYKTRNLKRKLKWGIAYGGYRR